MIGMIPAKIVAVLAVGGSIFYGMAHLRDRDVPDGVRSRLEGALVPAALRRSSSLVVLQRRAAENDTCASPTMTADCTLARRAAGNGPNGAKSSSDEAKDPSVHRHHEDQRKERTARKQPKEQEIGGVITAAPKAGGGQIARLSGICRAPGPPSPVGCKAAKVARLCRAICSYGGVHAVVNQSRHEPRSN